MLGDVTQFRLSAPICLRLPGRDRCPKTVVPGQLQKKEVGVLCSWELRVTGPCVVPVAAGSEGVAALAYREVGQMILRPLDWSRG